MNTSVARQFDVDFIYLDFVFTAIWMLLLWRQKHMLEVEARAGRCPHYVPGRRHMDVPHPEDAYSGCSLFSRLVFSVWLIYRGNGDVLLCNCNVQCYEDEYQGVLDSISLPWMGRDRVPVPVDSY